MAKKKEQPKKIEQVDGIPDEVKDMIAENNLFGNVEEDSESKTEGEDIQEIIATWLSDKFIHAKTRLNANQVVALTILKTLSEKYEVKCIKSLINNFVRYKLSEGGQSSKELVEILKNRDREEGDDELEKAIAPFMR